VKGNGIVIDGENFGTVAEYQQPYETTIGKLMN
jgi:hypothetical protein